MSFSKENQCESVMNWIYKELTLENLELSYQRAFQKFLYSVYIAQKNTQRKFKFSNELTQVFNALKNIDSTFDQKNIIAKNRTVWWTEFLSNQTDLGQENLFSAMKEWAKLQKEQPDFFLGMDETFYLDNWDLGTMKIIDQYNTFNFSSVELKNKAKVLFDKIHATKTNLIDNNDFSSQKINHQLISFQMKLKDSLAKKGRELINHFQSLCDAAELNQYLELNNYVCPLPDNYDPGFENLNLQLNSIQSILDQSEVLQSKKPQPTIDTLPVQTTQNDLLIYKYEYEVNDEATFCKRDMKMVSKIVIHHTDSPKDVSPAWINQIHLNNSTDGDPWYMIGYNYIISEHYNGADTDNPSIVHGRLDTIKGAHAGGFTKPLSKDQRKFYSKFDIMCGNSKIGFKKINLSDQMNDSGGLNGNLVSLGIAIIGKYAQSDQVKLDNGEILPKGPLVSSVDIPSEGVLNKTAALICQLQKQNPTIKTIVPHNYFKNTSCPGNLVQYFDRIKTKASELGCQFDVQITKGDNE